MHSKSQRIAIFGGSGLLGARLIDRMNFLGYEVLSPSSQKINLFNLNLLTQFIAETKPNTIINLVALTDVDSCENFPQEAYLKNAKTVQNIFIAIRNANINTHVVHISTDHLYDSIDESNEEVICLRNYYAYSKYLGELMVDPAITTILRTNFFGKSHTPGRSSFTDWLYDSLTLEQKINVYEDVLFSPLSISTLIKMIILVNDKKLPGIFNLGSKNGFSKADFAFKFASLVEPSFNNMVRSKLSDHSLGKDSNRPKNMLMNSGKFEKVYEVRLPQLCDEIELVMKEDYEQRP